ncbi:MAG: ParB N-terminal domain-containing protein [Clostridia bacterium]|nr:ParB N-terminal domain-containing protein [Clostridia bacterium]
MAKKLTIPKQQFPTSVADAYNELLGIDTNRVVNLPLSQLDEIDDQPFPVNESKVDQIADSIENVGVIEPIIVVKNGERYSILSGRHRFRACYKLGKDEIPCYIKETDDTTARYILIATNTDRNNEYSPIVYARAYAEQIELMKKLGKKSVVNAIAEQNGINRKQIYRYLRLNYLIPDIQKLVEDKILTIEAAVELSFLSDKKQIAFFEYLNNLGIADNIITRNFKVAVTKKIHIAAENISDDEFAANVDKIVFGKYNQDAEKSIESTVLSEQTVNEADIGSEKQETEEIIKPSEEAVSVLLPASKKQTKEKMGLEAPKIEPEEITEDEYESNDRVTESPTARQPDRVANKSTIEEVIKGYMLLALQAHGIETENISIAQIDSIFGRYSKNEAAEVYRKGL